MRKVQKDLLTKYNKTLMEAIEEKYFQLFKKKDTLPDITKVSWQHQQTNLLLTSITDSIQLLTP